MSKKIKIPLNNIKHYLHDLFHEYLDERYDLERTQRPRNGGYYDYMDDDEVMWLMQNGYVFPGMDDDDYANFYDDDDSETVFPLVKPKKGKKGKKRTAQDIYDEFWNHKMVKHKKKHKKGKARLIDINTPYSGDEDDPDEVGYDDLSTNGIDDGKEIFYYPNYNNKEDRLEFNTLKEFDDFCADYGYVVPPYLGEEIAYRRVSHVCLNPIARGYGMFEIMGAESYADMMYEACDVDELGC